MEKRPKGLLDQVRETIRVKHYSIRTEEAYAAWIRRFILFHDKRHPREMGTLEIETLSHPPGCGQKRGRLRKQRCSR